MKETKKPLHRSQVPEEMKWNVAKIYADEKAWRQDFARVKDLTEGVAKYRGTLSRSPQDLLAFLQYQDELGLLADKVGLYASLRRDEDTADAHYQGMFQQVQGLAVEVGAALSFSLPEILAIDPKELATWLTNPKLSLYARYISEITRQREHIRNQAEEEILALSGEIAATSNDVFNMLNNADISFPEISLGDENITLTHGNYLLFMESEDKGARKQAFKAMMETYARQKNTLAALMASNIKKDIFYAKVRKYPSCLAGSLDDEEIPVLVYDRLIKEVRQHLPEYHRYLALKKQALGLDELHLYDVYAPVVNDVAKTYEYEEAKKIVAEALKPLGAEYGKILQKGLASGWVDVLENQGKRSGAYSSGAYGTAPYVLLNYQANLNSVFTLAHEMGHSMHSFYSWREQPYAYAYYRIFVAEVASTVNENLLVQYLLAKTDDPKMQLYLINHYLEEFRGTVFRQVMFAEFEKMTHERGEAGLPLSCDWLSETYYQLNCDYFGPDVVVDKEIAMEWARIPHFYRSFYVYKYATGFGAATALAKGILDRKPQAVEKYLSFLSGGSSADPITLLRKAGIDMTDKGAMEGAFAIFSCLLDKMEALLAVGTNK